MTDAGTTGTAPKRGRRRTLVAAAIGAAVLLAAAGHLLVLRHVTSAPATVAAVVPPSAVPLSHPPFRLRAVNGRIGQVVDTGIPAGRGTRWVLSFVPATWSTTADITIALSIGERDDRGTITEALTISDDRLTDHAPGFHPMQAPMDLLDSPVQPAFGYYVGRPARITAVFDDVTPVTAHLATFSEDPDVTIFWFDPAEGAVDDVSDVGAFDAAGNRLPDGTIRVSYY